MTGVQVFTGGLLNLLVALVVAVAIFGGSALLIHRKDRRQLERDLER